MLTAMSSGKSEGSHSGPYGAAVITSFSWFSGKSAPSRKFMIVPFVGYGCKRGVAVRPVIPASEGRGADDAGALHLAMAGGVIHDRIVLGGAVVPEGDT